MPVRVWADPPVRRNKLVLTLKLFIVGVVDTSVPCFRANELVTSTLPLAVTVEPDWLSWLSPIVKPLPVNTGIVPAVPLPPIAPPPVPTQLLDISQTWLPF